MTSQMIRRYAINAEFIETTLVVTRSACGKALVGMMKDDGFVPLLDVNPVWQTEYHGGEKYTGTLTMQGVFVGKDRAWQIDGMVDGKLILSTKKHK